MTPRLTPASESTTLDYTAILTQRLECADSSLREPAVAVWGRLENCIVRIELDSKTVIRMDSRLGIACLAQINFSPLFKHTTHLAVPFSLFFHKVTKQTMHVQLLFSRASFPAPSIETAGRVRTQAVTANKNQML
ncbi:hypothetical protein J6590_023641 [Homalodisca vitripennis]|nr:hypothetical protein J6590_023641 [Homalodisca vitripennis]